MGREEHKLLKVGQLQLMPSRDRSGRRVVVFLGSYGFGFSHMNRVTSTGSVKTKNLIKWIRVRTSLEEQQNKLNTNTTGPAVVGIECPDLNSVLIRNGGPAWDHPGNVKFRQIIKRREIERDQQTTRTAKNQL